MFESVEPCVSKAAFELEPFPEAQLPKEEPSAVEVVQSIVDSAFETFAEEERAEQGGEAEVAQASLETAPSPFLMAEDVESENVILVEAVDPEAPEMEIADVPVEFEVAEAAVVVEDVVEEEVVESEVAEVVEVQAQVAEVATPGEQATELSEEPCAEQKSPSFPFDEVEENSEAAEVASPILEAVAEVVPEQPEEVEVVTAEVEATETAEVPCAEQEPVFSPFDKVEESSEAAEVASPILEAVAEEVPEQSEEVEVVAAEVEAPETVEEPGAEQEPAFSPFDKAEESSEVEEVVSTVQEEVPEVVEAEVVSEESSAVEASEEVENPFDLVSEPQVMEPTQQAPTIAAPEKSYFEPQAGLVATVSQTAAPVMSWEPPAPSTSKKKQKKKSNRFGAFFKQ